MDYKADIELLKGACHSIESEWGYDTAKKYFDAVDRIKDLLEGKYDVGINGEQVNAYVISRLDSQTLYETLKKEVRFEVLVECLKMLNKDLIGCLKDNEVGK